MDRRDFSILLNEIADIKQSLCEIKELLEKQSKRNENIKKETIQVVDKIIEHHLRKDK